MVGWTRGRMPNSSSSAGPPTAARADLLPSAPRISRRPSPVRTDRGLVEELKRRCPDLLAVDDIAHRAEHSIEFQVILLQHLLGAKRSFRILPILCGSFHEWILAGQLPSDDPRVRSVFEALREAISAQGKPVCLVAGADLAHVGARFGDPGPITPDLLRWIEDQDKQMLELWRPATLKVSSVLSAGRRIGAASAGSLPSTPYSI